MASGSNNRCISIPMLLWVMLILDLRWRGQGRRESGAFLLGADSDAHAKVKTYVCYDDLDSNAYEDGAIAFHAQGHAALWQKCREEQLDVLADVHTHPGRDVRQSWIDQRHPMMPIVGHTAMIVPNFGKTRWWSLELVGIYEYLGDFKWKTHASSGGPLRVKLTLW